MRFTCIFRHQHEHGFPFWSHQSFSILQNRKMHFPNESIVDESFRIVETRTEQCTFQELSFQNRFYICTGKIKHSVSADLPVLRFIWSLKNSKSNWSFQNAFSTMEHFEYSFCTAIDMERMPTNGSKQLLTFTLFDEASSMHDQRKGFLQSDNSNNNVINSEFLVFTFKCRNTKTRRMPFAASTMVTRFIQNKLRLSFHSQTLVYAHQLVSNHAIMIMRSLGNPIPTFRRRSQIGKR